MVAAVPGLRDTSGRNHIAFATRGFPGQRRLDPACVWWLYLVARH